MFPIVQGGVLIGRRSREEIKNHLLYYRRLPEWARKLIDSATSSITLNSKDITTSYISKAHIWLEPHDEFARIVDLASKNGTYVNGEMMRSDDHIHEVRLVGPEDTVSIAKGIVLLRYKPVLRPQCECASVPIKLVFE